MVTRDIKIVESDLSGEPGAETTLIGLRGEVMEVDLTSDERGELEQILAPYVAKARVVGPLMARSGATRRAPESTPTERAEIRAWARDAGYEVSEFGQVPKRVVRAYREARGRAEPAEGAVA